MLTPKVVLRSPKMQLWQTDPSMKSIEKYRQEPALMGTYARATCLQVALETCDSQTPGSCGPYPPPMDEGGVQTSLEWMASWTVDLERTHSTHTRHWIVLILSSRRLFIRCSDTTWNAKIMPRAKIMWNNIISHTHIIQLQQRTLKTMTWHDI